MEERGQPQWDSTIRHLTGLKEHLSSYLPYLRRSALGRMRELSSKQMTGEKNPQAIN
jgi:hypothetical protein